MSDQPATPVASDFMTTHVEVVTPDMHLSDVIHFLLKHHVSNAPVVELKDGKKILQGFITEHDCLCALSDEVFFGFPSPPQTARTIMTAHPICITPHTELFSIVSVFNSHKLRHLPVVENGHLLGIVSRHDILKEMDEYYKKNLHHQDHERMLRDTSQTLNLRFTIDRDHE